MGEFDKTFVELAKQRDALEAERQKLAIRHGEINVSLGGIEEAWKILEDTERENAGH